MIFFFCIVIIAYVTKQRHITKPVLVNIFITLFHVNLYFKDDGFVKVAKITIFRRPRKKAAGKARKS
jgi:hypothetical protein